MYLWVLLAKWDFDIQLYSMLGHRLKPKPRLSPPLFKLEAGIALAKPASDLNELVNNIK